MEEVTGVFRRRRRRERTRSPREVTPRDALALEAFGGGAARSREEAAFAETVQSVRPRPASEPGLVRPRSTIPLPGSYEPNLASEDDPTVTSYPDVSGDFGDRWRRRVLFAGLLGIIVGLISAGWLLLS